MGGHAVRPRKAPQHTLLNAPGKSGVRARQLTCSLENSRTASLGDFVGCFVSGGQRSQRRKPLVAAEERFNSSIGMPQAVASRVPPLAGDGSCAFGSGLAAVRLYMTGGVRIDARVGCENLADKRLQRGVAFCDRKRRPGE